MINLLAERKNRGFSQRRMAEVVGVTCRVWQTAETGEAEPRGENARKIAEFFDVKVTDIWPLSANGEAA